MHPRRRRQGSMVDPVDPIEKARQAVTQRAELPGMSLMEHLDELRRRIVHSALYLGAGFAVAYIFHERLYGLVQQPLDRLHIKLNYTHPMDALNLYLQVSLIGGAILASPFILYQVWLFIAPGLYQKERRFVVPFMAATVGLFLAGAAFGYFYVLPGALKILIVDFGKTLQSDYHDRGVHGVFPVDYSRVGDQLRDADSDFLSGAVWDCEPEIFVEEHSLCGSGGVSGGGDYYA
jgi:hypothetical protein